MEVLRRADCSRTVAAVSAAAADSPLNWVAATAALSLMTAAQPQLLLLLLLLVGRTGTEDSILLLLKTS